MQAQGDDAPSRELVYRLQRVLANGCREWVSRDGLLGPQTLGAYRRCRQRMAIVPVDVPGHSEDVEALIDELWLRKHALILLHQSGYLTGDYQMTNRDRIEAALESLSTAAGLVPPLSLCPDGIGRLTDWYDNHPPAGSIGAALREHGLRPSGLDIYLQVYKLEQEVLVWVRPTARDTPYVLLKTFGVTGSTFTYPLSGSPQMAGPKTQQGDLKVPEGCYQLTWQNEWSDFYLGYLLSYPNQGDSVRRQYWREGRRSGGAIVLHGGSATVGCIPVGNSGIEELYLLLSRNWRQGQRHGVIHLFPFRFWEPENEVVLQRYSASRPELAEFWGSLRAVSDYFQEHRHLPQIDFNAHTGHYVLAEPR